MRKKEYIALGGTFSSLHVGHQYMLEECVQISIRSSRIILIGISSGPLITTKSYRVPSYSLRKRQVEKFLSCRSCQYKFIAIRSEFGPITTERYDVDLLLASPETVDMARKINVLRKRRGHKYIPLYIIDYVENFMGQLVSSTFINCGVINSWGLPI